MLMSNAIIAAGVIAGFFLLSRGFRKQNALSRENWRVYEKQIDDIPDQPYSEEFGGRPRWVIENKYEGQSSPRPTEDE